MKFGFLKHSLVDYPGEVCAVVFIPGCNFHCPYCHNQNLEADVEQNGWTLEQILSYLRDARRLLTGVCISGGEPTLQPDLLFKLIGYFKALNLKIKLDTNGSRSEVLKSVAPEVDYVAMDLKTSPKRYLKLAHPNEAPSLLTNLNASVSLLLQRPPETYEFRTTLSPFWADESALHDIGQIINEESRWYLQRCRGEEPRNAFERLEEEHRIQLAVDIAKSYSKHVFLRR
jgi:pyruvate formate lyase activating enzyme